MLVPVGLAANLLVTLEALINIVGVALATGLVFARFSRPGAKIIYSDKALIAPYRNGSALDRDARSRAIPARDAVGRIEILARRRGRSSPPAHSNERCRSQLL